VRRAGICSEKKGVIAGLDPAIHPAKKMDARVKPAHDNRCILVIASQRVAMTL
jgi:hypothetical protein